MDRYSYWRKRESTLKRLTAKRSTGIFIEEKLIDEIDVDLFFKLAEKIAVRDYEMLIVNLLDGTEIEVKN